MDFNKILSSILICPVSFNKTSGKEENCPTKITKNKIYFTGNNYNIIKKLFPTVVMIWMILIWLT